MTQKQYDKHRADRAAAEDTRTDGKSSLDAAEPTLDGLGPWEGGTAALKGSNRWVAEKSHPSRTADTKNAPGVEYASKITHRQDADFNEVHTDANGQFWLYNVKTDAWDIKGDSSDIPHYIDEDNKEWAYNYKTGAWDVPVVAEDQEGPYFDAELIARAIVTDTTVTDEGDAIASAIA